MFEPLSAVSLGFAALACGWAAFERLRGLKRSDHVLVEVERDKLLELMKANLEERTRAHEREHAEFLEYRRSTHELNETTQSKILNLTEEIANLRNKTDITPIIEYQKTQNEINKTILDALNKILSSLSTFVTHTECSRFRATNEPAAI